jgi:hypothetical protein
VAAEVIIKIVLLIRVGLVAHINRLRVHVYISQFD